MCRKNSCGFALPAVLILSAVLCSLALYIGREAHYVVRILNAGRIEERRVAAQHEEAFRTYSAPIMSTSRSLQCYQREVHGTELGICAVTGPASSSLLQTPLIAKGVNEELFPTVDLDSLFPIQVPCTNEEHALLAGSALASRLRCAPWILQGRALYGGNLILPSTLFDPSGVLTVGSKGYMSGSDVKLMGHTLLVAGGDIRLGTVRTDLPLIYLTLVSLTGDVELLQATSQIKLRVIARGEARVPPTPLSSHNILLPETRIKAATWITTSRHLPDRD